MKSILDFARDVPPLLTPIEPEPILVSFYLID